MNIPDGYLHRAQLIERGWTARLINDLIDAEYVVKIDDVAEGVSPRCYLTVEVERIEATHKDVKKLVRNRACLIPRREGGYEKEETVARSRLVEQGWTPALVERLLGAPDVVEEAYGYKPVHRYATERIAEAIATDTRLQKRLATVAEKKQAEKDARIAETVETGFGVWRKVGTEWLVQAKGIDEGDVIEVAKKDGSRTRHQVLAIVSDEKGTQLARVSKPLPAHTAPAVGAADKPASAPKRCVADEPGSITEAQINAIWRHVQRGDHEGSWCDVPDTLENIKALSRSEASQCIDALRNP